MRMPLTWRDHVLILQESSRYACSNQGIQDGQQIHALEISDISTHNNSQVLLYTLTHCTTLSMHTSSRSITWSLQLCMLSQTLYHTSHTDTYTQEEPQSNEHTDSIVSSVSPVITTSSCNSFTQRNSPFTTFLNSRCFEGYCSHPIREEPQSTSIVLNKIECGCLSRLKLTPCKIETIQWSNKVLCVMKPVQKACPG